jgi:hypothetical protein
MNVMMISKIERRILLIRGVKVIVDTDLAEFYGAETKRLNEQVKRNKNRFPSDFMFRLNTKEKSEVVANCDHLSKLKYSRTLPYVFTEHGAIMAANILNSKVAVEMSVFLVRAFIKLRQSITQHKELTRKISRIERRLADHDHQILSMLRTLKHLINPTPIPKKRRIGF